MKSIQTDILSTQENSSLTLPDYPETIIRLYRKHSYTALQKVLSRIFPSDLARILDGYAEDDAAKIFFIIPSHRLAASTLKYMGQELRNHLMQDFLPEKLIPILEELPPDDRADIIGHLNSSLANRFMGGLDEESMREVADLLQYDSDTAGGLMTPDFFALTENTTVGAAIEAIRSLPYIEMVFYLYVLDDRDRLIGVSSLRQLILNDPSKTLGEIMTPRIVSVTTNTPSNEVAEMVKHYRLLGVPVVDDMDVLVGVVTVDDVISTLEQDITEDVLKMSTTTQPEVVELSAFKSFTMLLPWLVAALGGGLVVSGLLYHFMKPLNNTPLLAFFIPMVMNMAGSMGMATTIRDMELDDFQESSWQQIASLFGKELRMSLIMGLVLGLIGGLSVWLLFNDSHLGQAVGLTLLLNMIVGTFFALVLALSARKLRTTPEIISSRILTTILDVVGVSIYFFVAKMLLGV